MKRKKAPSSPPEQATPTVRERTMAHMKKLLHGTTRLRTGIALACGIMTQACIPIADPAPPPPPPPGVCANSSPVQLRQIISADAHWVKSGKKWTINVSVHSHWSVSGTYLRDLAKDNVRVSKASIDDLTAWYDELNIDLTPVAGATEVELDFSAQCEQIRVPVRLKLDIRKKHKKNAEVLVEIS